MVKYKSENKNTRANLLNLHQVIFIRFLILAFITALNSCGISDSKKQERGKKIQDSISQEEQAEKKKIDSIDAEEMKQKQIEMENLEKKILADIEKQTAERKKTCRFMFDSSKEFPMKYQIPKCPFQDERTTPSSRCDLAFYYARPGAKNWEKEIPTLEFVNLMTHPNMPFYGKEGWKYAFSWDGDNSRPIQLRALNEKQVWPIE